MNALMQHLDEQYLPRKWRLFIDSNKTSLKAVLLQMVTENHPIPEA